MQFEESYDCVCNDGNNNYFIEMNNGFMKCEVNSACFSILNNWKDDFEWMYETYDKEKHAPKHIDYMINHSDLSKKEFLFWTRTIMEHPALETQDVERNQLQKGYVRLSGNLEHNFLLHELGMLRAMREYPTMCRAAYALFEIAKTGKMEQDHKIARLVMYLSSQFCLENGEIYQHSRNGGGGHDPAGTPISQLDLAHYVNGGMDIGGESLIENPSYNNISNGLFYHNVPAYGLRKETLGQLSGQWATFFDKHGQNIKKLNVEEFKKLVKEQVVGLDLLLSKSKKLIEAKAVEKIKGKVKRAKLTKVKEKRAKISKAKRAKLAKIMRNRKRLAERKLKKQCLADNGLPF